MEVAGGVLVFAGLLVAGITDIYIIVIAFRYRLSAGLYCLFLTPIYAFVNMRKEGKVRKAFGAWVIGFGTFLLGMLISSIRQ